MLHLIDNYFPWLGDIVTLGGPVLVVILFITFIMWSLIIERFYYLWFVHPMNAQRVQALWDERTDHFSWHAHQIRQQLISVVSASLDKNMGIIKSLVALCPLLGLLGTVLGMLEVFDVMAATGSNNPRTMAAGVSKATVSTLAGMVAALSGLMLGFYLSNRAATERSLLSGHLPVQKRH